MKAVSTTCLFITIILSLSARGGFIYNDDRPRLESQAGYSVDTATGFFKEEVNLVSLPGPMELSVDLVSTGDESRQLRQLGVRLGPGQFGSKWTHQYEALAYPFEITIDGVRREFVTVVKNAKKGNLYEKIEDTYVQRSGPPGNPGTHRYNYDVLVETFLGGKPGYSLKNIDGTSWWFGEDGKLAWIQDKNNNRLDIERGPYGRIASITEGFSRQKVFFNDPQGPDGCSAITYGNGAYRRVVSSGGERIYDPIQLAVFGTVTADIPIPAAEAGGERTSASMVVPVPYTAENRIINLQGVIAGGDTARNLLLVLTSPSGTSVNLSSGPSRDYVVEGDLFSFKIYLDQFRDEPMAGNWTLTATDFRAEGGTNTFKSLTILASTEEANWTEYEFRPYSGMITRALDSKGQQIYANTYDTKGRVVAQADGQNPAGVWKFEYETPPYNLTITRVFPRDAARYGSGNNVYATYEHSSNFNLLTYSDEEGNVTRYTHSPGSSLRISKTDPNRNSTQFRYTADGYLIQRVDPDGAKTTFDHKYGIVPISGHKLLSRVTDALGNVTLLDYDQFNNLSKIIDPLKNAEIRAYENSLLQTATSKEPANVPLNTRFNKDPFVVNYEYNNQALPSVISSGEGQREEIQYDNLGRPIRITDAAGYASTITYDIRGNIIEKKHLATGNTVRSTYDHRNRLTTETDAMGGTTEYFYDGNNNLASIRNAENESTDYSYDAEDRLIRTSVESDGYDYVVSEKGYNRAGRLVEERNDLRTIRYAYDPNGNLTRTWQELYGSGYTEITLSETTYDKMNRPTLVVDTLGESTRFTYDLLGQEVARSSLILGDDTTFSYDAMNRLVKVVDPLQRTFTKNYGWDDVLWEMTDAAGKTTYFDYTERNQLELVETPGGGITTFGYDARGYIDTYSPETVERTQEYIYNSAGRLERIIHLGDFPDIVYTYDANGNVTQVATQPIPGEGLVVQITRTYDKLNRLTSNTDAYGTTISHVYNGRGLIRQIIYADGGSSVTYDYDDLGRLASTTDWLNRMTTYTWGSDDQIEKIQFPNGTSRVMEYSDSRILMNRSDYDSAGDLIVSYDYSYDLKGFIATEQVGGPPPPPYAPTAASFTYDDDNRIETVNGSPVSYDADGNVTQGPVMGTSQSFVWNDRNNLMSVGFDQQFIYDVEDRLVGWGSGFELVDFTVVGNGGGSRIFESRKGAALTRYVYGIGLAYADTGGQIQVFHYDERGNTVALSGNSGLVTGRLAYSPFGDVLQADGQTDTVFKYGGLFGVVAAPNGLNYMRYRWYSPEMNRFVSRDSVIGDISLPSSLNRYTFARNNPVNFNDPEGEFWNVVIGAAAGATFGAVTEILSSGLQGKAPNWDYVAAAAIGGAIQGGLAGAGGIGFAIAGGALGSVGENVVRREAGDTDVTLGRIASGAVVGGFLRGGLAGNSLRSNPLRKAFQESNKTFKGAVQIELGTFLRKGELARKGFIEKTVKRRLVLGTLSNLSRDYYYEAKGQNAESIPPGNPGSVIEGATRVPTSKIGQGGEHLHYRRYLQALIDADRPLPNPPENL